MKSNRFILASLLMAVCLCCGARAQPGPPEVKVAAFLDATALAAGKPARLAIVLKVPGGMHAQSHAPLDDSFIKCEVSLDQGPAGVTFGQPAYPAGVKKHYEALGDLSVYEGKTVIVVPITVAGDANTGAVELAGKLTCQICDDQSCYPPDTIKFKLSAQIVPDAASVKPANPVLFPPAPNQPPVQAPTRAPVLATPTTSPSVVPLAGAPLQETPPPPPLTFSLLGIGGTIDSLGAAFAAALVAGLLFNVMPCVLPVLPLKAIGFYEAGQHHRVRSFGFGLAFSLGVIAIFGGLALLVVFSKPIFGSQISWGQQFSNKWFVGAIVLVLTALGLSMLGAFSLRLPNSIYGLSFRHDTFTGNVMWGGLTAVLSTPCTAPLFPLVLAVALATKSTVIGVALVLSVGVGMALPYLLLSAFPEVVRRFPRTGPFSELFRQLLAFPIFGTAAFFFGALLGSPELQTLLIFGVTVAAAVFLLMRTSMLYAGRARPMFLAGAAASLIVGVTLWTVLPTAEDRTAMATDLGGVEWQNYSAQKQKDSLAAGNPVLVKFTAKWCANCIVLEKTVYKDRRVISALRDRHVVAMHLDVDKEGWDLLNALAPGAGIPYTALYLPTRPQPLLLASMHDANALLELVRRNEVAVAVGP